MAAAFRSSEGDFLIKGEVEALLSDFSDLLTSLLEALAGQNFY